jgi:uncharacterized membrane protein YqaE (UPF0057 family)
MNQDPVDAIIVGSVVLTVLGVAGMVTAVWLIVRDYLQGRG